ncbi:hypothetical protein E2C01_039596 [Portunus trituberculatus]|uniref:Uncharacterized protein n=1 Tax=Portunus trituberculatus TaxID=210409 RepID=A0A5B7FE19_PORTR|nr:hypothetical protein [Portunus trituberculatus]
MAAVGKGGGQPRPAAHSWLGHVPGVPQCGNKVTKQRKSTRWAQQTALSTLDLALGARGQRGAGPSVMASQ